MREAQPMAQPSKLLQRMRRNPAGDWMIADVERLCRAHGLACVSPKRGDHYKVSHESQVEIVTIPAHRPIKAPYIRKLVSFIDDVIESHA